MESFGIANTEKYRSEYSRLGAALGLPEAATAPSEVEFLAEITRRNWCGIGILTTADVFFAAAVTSILHPPTMIEIGTASGFSAAIFAKTIALRNDESRAGGTGPLVQTIDKSADFVFDRTKRVGFAIDLIAPTLRERIMVHPEHDSSFCRELISDRSLRFAFVDGNHRHPWPLIDVLRIQCLMESGWILLHDVDLPAVVARAQAEGQAADLEPAAGAKHVFDFWPEEKIKAGNIGAVKLPRDRHSLGKLVAELRELPSEVSPGMQTKQWREIESLTKEFTRRGWFRSRHP
ncbi:MAG: class I SAM-dependent methyltransferase [Chthoniobacterales bacterium]